MLHSRRSRPDGERQRGQILILFELVLIVILGFAAMVVDLGVLRNNRQILVNTLDAAALVGASRLPVDGTLPSSDSHSYQSANAAIDANIAKNYPVPPAPAYSIVYRCLIGADPNTHVPLISRDIPGVCDPHNALGHAPVATDFVNTRQSAVSACDPTIGDKCNVVMIMGSSTTQYALAPVMGVNDGSTGMVVAAACKGTCGAATVVPVDLVIILDRTGSMADGNDDNGPKIQALQTAAKAVLKVYDPAKQRVGLAMVGPGKTNAAGNAALGTCDATGSGSVYGTSDTHNWVGETTLSQAMGLTTTLDATTLAGSTTLNGAINNSTTAVKLASATGFPTAGRFTIMVDSEQMVVTAGQGTVNLTVLRGQNGTTQASHTNGKAVYLLVGTTTLNGAITAGATTIHPTSATGFPATAPFTILVDSEQMVVTAGAGTVNWTVLRGQNGTASAAHATLATVSMLVGTTDTSIGVATAAGFQTSGNYVIQIDSEQMLVTAGAGTKAWTVTRHYNGTAAAWHDGGSPVMQVSVTVASAAEFPTSGAYTIAIDNEVMSVTAGQGTTTWIVTRGVSGSPMAAHTSGSSSYVNRHDVTIAGPSTFGAWVPVGLSGTDTSTPLPSPNGIAGTYSTAGIVNPNSTIVQSINCISASSDATNLSTPLLMAKWYLDNYGRPGVTQGIILETDGHPQNGYSHDSNMAGTNASWTCQAAVAAADAAKADTTNSPDGIQIFTIGYGVDSSSKCPTATSNWADANTSRNMAESSTGVPTGSGWSGKPATDFLRYMATDADHYFENPTSAQLEQVFTQAANMLAKSGAHLIQLYPPPIVTGASGSAASVTVTGKFLTGAVQVRFGIGLGTNINVINDGTLTVTAPAAAKGTIVDVVVTTAGGISSITSADKYTYP